MLDANFSLHGEFPPAKFEQWQKLVDAGLNGKSFDNTLISPTREGIDIKPLYTREDRPPVDVVHTETIPSVCELRQKHANPEPHLANQEILSDVAGRVTSLQLSFDLAAQAGLCPDDPRAADLVGRGGLMAYQIDDLEQLLVAVSLSTLGVGLEAGAAFLPLAAIWFASCSRQQLLPKELRGALNADPLGALAKAGRLPYSISTGLAQLTDLAQWTSQNAPQVTAVGVDTAPYHIAGATATQELAFALATAVEYLRAMTNAGLQTSAAARQILFCLNLDANQFRSVSTLRAARLLWARVLEACGVTPDSSPMKIHAVLGERTLTSENMHWNMFRNSVVVFAAEIGGANAVTSLPFDYVTGQSSGFSRRLARNTTHVLREEADLENATDPAEGSFFLECYTHQLAQQAWDIFQDVERQGGMVTSLQNGWIGEQISSAPNRPEQDEVTEGVVLTNARDSTNLLARDLGAPPDPQQLRNAAIQRLKKSRKNVSMPEEISQGPERVETAIDAAGCGASVGRLSQALGFHREFCELPEVIGKRDA